jgi:hypothetical protein
LATGVAGWTNTLGADPVKTGRGVMAQASVTEGEFVKRRQQIVSNPNLSIAEKRKMIIELQGMIVKGRQDRGEELKGIFR